MTTSSAIPRNTTARARGCRAVVFDLFGTLVNAPSRQDRSDAATELAAAFGTDAEQVRQALARSWRDRHLGTLASVPAIAGHLADRCGAAHPDLASAATLIRRRARRRLACDRSVLTMLTTLHARRTAVAILSDAAAETAEAWPHTALAPLPVFFSCHEHAVKPDPVLYTRVLDHLGVPAPQVLYCGDGGGDELAGAARAGLVAVAVPSRGAPDVLAHNISAWHGPTLPHVEHIAELLRDHV
ncbi:HAD family hydrolase [Amycolatopsis magusensis]|uniref:HAD family hydrolase n=1 Tax=Amycolatopsis magusensis TaxID=882444 RepID=UPI0037B2FD47